MITLHADVACSVETIPVIQAATGSAFAATANAVHAFPVSVQTDGVASSITAGASGAAIPASVTGITPIIPDPYTGEYEVTPSGETQILATANHGMTRNVIVNPIPSNYGRITWNGAILTVS